MRTVCYVSRYAMQGNLSMLGMAALYVLFSVLTASPQQPALAGQLMVVMLAMVGLLFPALLEMNLLPIHLPLVLSMGATRREGFWGFGAAKVEFVIGLGAILVLAQSAAQGFFGAPPVLAGGRFVRVLALLFLSASIGEFCGVLGMRFGGKLLMGLSLAMGLLCGLCGGFLGFQLSAHTPASVLTLLLSLLDGMTAAVPAACVVFPVESVGSWLLCRRCTVR